MACFFGHKWNGCTCEKCGATRNQFHDFQLVDGKCEEKCSRCGKTQSISHEYKLEDGKCIEKCVRCGKERNVSHSYEPVKDECLERCSRCGHTREKHEYDKGFCIRCGKKSDRPFDLNSLDSNEKEAVRKALDIARQSNQDDNLKSAYDKTANLLQSTMILGGDEILLVYVALMNVGQALAGSINQMMNTNMEEAMARTMLAVSMSGAMKKIDQMMTEFNEEVARRDGSAEFEETIRSVFNISAESGSGANWDKPLKEEIDKLVAGGEPALIAIQKAMVCCSTGTGAAYNEAWQKGAINLVRILGKFSQFWAQNRLLVILETNGVVDDWFMWVQAEAADVLDGVADRNAIPRIEKILSTPFPKGPNEKLRALLEKLKDAPERTGEVEFIPYNGEGICDVCGKNLKSTKAWVIPNDVFYAAPKYREWYRNHIGAMGISAAEADANLDRMQKQDTTQGSAICEDCVHLFK